MTIGDVLKKLNLDVSINTINEIPWANIKYVFRCEIASAAICIVVLHTYIYKGQCIPSYNILTPTMY